MSVEFLQEWVLTFAGSAWIFALVYLLCVIDGFFPPIPSETVVIALAATWAAAGVPNVWLLWLVAAFGAFTGDQVAYLIGLNVNVRALRPFRGARGRAALDWAGRALGSRGASFIVTARFVPVGRVAVNMTAGAVRYPRHRFMPLVLLAGLIWAAYGIALGVLAGRWFEDNPLLAVAAGVASGLVVGYLIDLLLRRLSGRSTPAGTAAPGKRDGG